MVDVHGVLPGHQALGMTSFGPHGCPVEWSSEDTEAQRGLVICSESHRQKWQNLGPSPGPCDPGLDSSQLCCLPAQLLSSCVSLYALTYEMGMTTVPTLWGHHAE